MFFIIYVSNVRSIGLRPNLAGPSGRDVSLYGGSSGRELRWVLRTGREACRVLRTGRSCSVVLRRTLAGTSGRDGSVLRDGTSQGRSDVRLAQPIPLLSRLAGPTKWGVPPPKEDPNGPSFFGGQLLRSYRSVRTGRSLRTYFVLPDEGPLWGPRGRVGPVAGFGSLLLRSFGPTQQVPSLRPSGGPSGPLKGVSERSEEGLRSRLSRRSLEPQRSWGDYNFTT